MAISYERPTVLHMIICQEGGHQLDDEMQLLIFIFTCGSHDIRPRRLFRIKVLVRQGNSMEDELSTESLDAFRGPVGAKDKQLKRASPALTIIIVLEI